MDGSILAVLAAYQKMMTLQVVQCLPMSSMSEKYDSG